MTGELVLSLLLALPQSDGAALQKQLTAKSEALTALLELQRRVRAGELPTAAELRIVPITREQLLGGIDVKRAVLLGMEPQAVRARLTPGFSAEIAHLEGILEGRAETGIEASPLYVLLLDFERDLFAVADRRRERAGIKSPLLSGPLAMRLESGELAAADSGTPSEDAAEDQDVRSGNDTLPVMTGDPRLVGQALYRAGRYAEALAAWKDVALPTGNSGLEFEYQRADSLLKVGDVEAASAAWQKLATDHADTTWGQQAEFALKVARAIGALQSAKAKDAGTTGAPLKDAPPKVTPPAVLPPKEIGPKDTPSKEVLPKEPAANPTLHPATKPTELNPAELKPREPKPKESKPKEASKPKESKPKESKPTEAKPAEPKGSDGKSKERNR